MSTYSGDFLLHSLPVLLLFHRDLRGYPEALGGASSTADPVEILLSLSSVSRSPLLFPFFSQSPQLIAVLFFESGDFLEVLVIERFPQCLQLCCQACRPDRLGQLHIFL